MPILNTPGSLSTAGYDKITSIEQGDSDKQVVVKFSEVYAPYKNLFGNIIKADAVPDCKDVSADMADNIPFSAMPYKIESWSLDQLVLVKNDELLRNRCRQGRQGRHGPQGRQRHRNRLAGRR